MLTLVIGYFLVWTCKLRQGKSTPHPWWFIKRTQIDRTHLSSTKTGDYWSLLHFYILSRKRYFFKIGVRSDNAEDDNILLQKRVGKLFCCILHCSEKTEFFRSNLLFHGQSITNLYQAGNCPPPIWLQLVMMDFALNKSYLQNIQSLSLTFLLPFTFLIVKSRGRLL